MRVLHINQSDTSGGAAIAGYRLHQGLLHHGIDSRLLVGRAVTTSERVAKVYPASASEMRLKRLTQRFGLNHVHLLSTSKLAQHPFYEQADILNLHNLHTGYFNYLAIAALTATKPAVFTLHDMWSFTGHCAYSYDCDRWKIGCGHCPYPDTYPAIRRDSTSWEWKLKERTYRHSNLTIVAPSRWLAEQAQSSMLNRFPIHCIPNGIDVDIYHPVEQDLCRAVLEIPQTKKVILFGAQTLQETRKGGDILQKALRELPESLKAETLLLTFGETNTELATEIGIPTLSLGYIGSDRLKAIAYSAADLFVFPTRADNLPLVLQESMACGTPMISFNIGGVPDLVRPGVTGYLAEPEDAADLSSGIMKLLDDDVLREQLGKNCRKIALEEYPLHLQASRYADLYDQILQN